MCFVICSSLILVYYHLWIWKGRNFSHVTCTWIFKMYIIWLKFIWFENVYWCTFNTVKGKQLNMITAICNTSRVYRITILTYIDHQALCHLLSYKYIEKYDNEILTMLYWLFGDFYHCLMNFNHVRWMLVINSILPGQVWGYDTQIVIIDSWLIVDHLMNCP